MLIVYVYYYYILYTHKSAWPKKWFKGNNGTLPAEVVVTSNNVPGAALCSSSSTILSSLRTGENTEKLAASSKPGLTTGTMHHELHSYLPVWSEKKWSTRPASIISYSSTSSIWKLQNEQRNRIFSISSDFSIHKTVYIVALWFYYIHPSSREIF